MPFLVEFFSALFILCLIAIYVCRCLVAFTFNHPWHRRSSAIIKISYLPFMHQPTMSSTMKPFIQHNTKRPYAHRIVGSTGSIQTFCHQRLWLTNYKVTVTISITLKYTHPAATNIPSSSQTLLPTNPSRNSYHSPISSSTSPRGPRPSAKHSATLQPFHWPT